MLYLSCLSNAPVSFTILFKIFCFVYCSFIVFYVFQNKIIDDWMETLCGGFHNAGDSFKELFRYLLPNCYKPNREQALQRVVEDGAVHCLVYGYQKQQLYRQNNRGMQKDTNLEHRFLLTRKPGDDSRSRSRSPASSDDEEDSNEDLNRNVYDSQNPRRGVVRLNALLNDPESYVIKPNKLYVYFESHKPDLVLFHKLRVPDTDYPGHNKEEYVAKVIIEISSFEKYVDDVVGHIQKNVEQCVQSCLAAFACNQDLMYGLVVVVDGFVLIKLQKQNQGGQEEFEITETDLLMWDNADDMNALFSTLNNVL